MRKGIILALGAIAVIALVVWADRRFPSPREVAPATSSGDASLPGIPVKDLHGEEISLSQYKGQVVLVNFWAIWCEPCRTEIPWLIAFQTKYSQRGFTIVGVSMDEEGKEAVAPFFEKERFDVGGRQAAMNYPVVLGNQSVGEKLGGILGLPTSMLFTRTGHKVKTITGVINRDELAKEIEAQL